MKDMSKTLEELQKAKDAVRALLEPGDRLVDMHGIAYWAGVVERLRREIKENI